MNNNFVQNVFHNRIIQFFGLNLFDLKLFKSVFWIHSCDAMKTWSLQQRVTACLIRLESRQKNFCFSETFFSCHSPLYYSVCSFSCIQLEGNKKTTFFGAMHRMEAKIFLRFSYCFSFIHSQLNPVSLFHAPSLKGIIKRSFLTADKTQAKIFLHFSVSLSSTQSFFFFFCLSRSLLKGNWKAMKFIVITCG